MQNSFSKGNLDLVIHRVLTIVPTHQVYSVVKIYLTIYWYTISILWQYNFNDQVKGQLMSITNLEVFDNNVSYATNTPNLVYKIVWN